MRKLLLFLSGLIFLGAAAVHGLRLIQGWDIIVAGRLITPDLSMYFAVGLGLLGLLCLLNARKA